jgi:DNA-directed RNA polymerase specialized sigma24 family protein
MSRGRDDDFGQFADAQVSRLVGLAFVLTGDPDAAWDLTERCLLAVASRWRGLRHDDPAAAARSILVGRHLRVADRSGGRRSRPGRDTGDVPTAASLIPLVQREPAPGWLLPALTRLTPQQRVALALTFVEDLEPADVSRALGWSPATADRNLADGLRALRSASAPLGENEHPVGAQPATSPARRDLPLLHGAFQQAARSVAVAVDIAPRIQGQRSRRRRTRLRLAAAGATVVVGLGALSQVMGPVGDHPDRTLRADLPVPYIQPKTLFSQWGWQRTFERYEGRLLTAASRHRNYTGFALDADRHLLTVFGTGRPAREVATLLDEAPPQLGTRWASVPYSRDDLQAAADDLLHAVPGARTVRVAPGYGAIIVGLHRLPASVTAMVPIHRLANAVTDVPVYFTLTYA